MTKDSVYCGTCFDVFRHNSVEETVAKIEKLSEET